MRIICQRTFDINLRQSALNFPGYIKSFGDILLSRMHECSENCQHMPFVVVVRLRFKLKATR